ncbi:hypothetical protein [Negadavirga shengliensis]|uniref:Uncharacterized protein n=1 Tax=Negadavirga shengliensis TaxID=1389218 RepID=A0ABV9T1I8_9BACT
MKELDYNQMCSVNGGADCSTSVGFGAGLAAATLVAGLATGGVGLLVIGGLSAYATGFGAIYCAMS